MEGVESMPQSRVDRVDREWVPWHPLQWGLWLCPVCPMGAMAVPRMPLPAGRPNPVPTYALGLSLPPPIPDSCPCL